MYPDVVLRVAALGWEFEFYRFIEQILNSKILKISILNRVLVYLDWLDLYYDTWKFLY
jgi:hypothetical protein